MTRHFKDSNDSDKTPEIPKILKGFQRLKRFWYDVKNSDKLPQILDIPEIFQRF